MSMRMRAACAAMVVGVFGVCESAHAFSFSVEPSRIELSVPAGKQRGKTVRVSSRSDRPVHLKMYVQDVVFLPDGTSDFPAPGSTAWSCAKWITIIPDELDIPPGKTQEVRVSVAVPPETRGGSYAMVFFESGPSYTEKGLGVNFRIGALTQVTVPNTEVYQAKLADLSVDSSRDVRVELFNEGNALIRPNGQLKVFDARNKKVWQQAFNIDRLGVLPKSPRSFHTTLGPLPKGSYRLKVEIDYGAKYLLGGERAFEIP